MNTVIKPRQRIEQRGGELTEHRNTGILSRILRHPLVMYEYLVTCTRDMVLISVKV